MRVVNIIRDFGATKFKINFPKKDNRIKQCIQRYNERVDIDQIVKDMIYELAITGNLACYDRDGDTVDIYPINQIEVLPITKGSKQLIGFRTDTMPINTFMYDTEVSKLAETAFPEEVLRGKKKGDIVAILNPDKAYFAKINSSRYERYGLPVILPAFDDLSHKSLLKEAERSTANDIIDKIMQIKIGDSDNKPSESLINKYNDLFNGVSGSIRVTVPYYVDISWIEPETSIFGQDKFIQIDNDILNTLGVSLTLIRGEGGGNYAEGMISFTGLTRTIENIRAQIPNIIHGLYQAELERNGLNKDNAPTISFDEVVIDKNAKLQLVRELFQNAGLPYEVLYDEFGYDFDYIKMIREDENEKNLEDVFKLRAQPFQGFQYNYQNQDDSDKDKKDEADEDKDEEEKENTQRTQKASKEAGAPQKDISQRKSDKVQSNNSAPRPGIKNRG